jgi:hypothetical protein
MWSVIAVARGGLPLSLSRTRRKYVGSSSWFRMEAGTSIPVLRPRLKAVAGRAGGYTYMQPKGSVHRVYDIDMQANMNTNPLSLHSAIWFILGDTPCGCEAYGM